MQRIFEAVVGTRYIKLNLPVQNYNYNYNYNRRYKIKWYFVIYIFVVVFLLFSFTNLDSANTTVITIPPIDANTNTNTESKSDSTSPDQEQQQSSSASGYLRIPTVKDPYSPNVNTLARGYKVRSVKTNRRDGTVLALLQLIGEPTGIYGYDYQTLNLKVEYQTNDRINIRIEPTNLTDVYIVPDDLLNRPQKSQSFRLSSSLKFTYERNPFSFNIKRRSNNEVLFSTLNNPLVFSNQFIQINTTLPSNHNISGLGESFHKFTSEPGSVRTIYANDKSSTIDGNMYGTHPVYYDERASGTHAVYWRSSAIQEVVIEETSLTWRSLSGVLDLYVYAGPTPKDAISQFVSSIGLPALQPYWALGYHQSRWGYKSLGELRGVVTRFKESDIPLETVWLDIDFMDEYKDFTNDEKNYPLDQLISFIQSLHDNLQHFVPIVDAAISYPGEEGTNNMDYPIYNDGLVNDVYLKNPDGSLYIGEVWPGATVFPDFLASKTKSWWSRTIQKWYEDVKFDGLWLDMNEASSFCAGGSTSSSKIKIKESSDSDSDSSSSNVVETPTKRNVNYPPYTINNVQESHDLASHGVSPNATHFDGTLEYDVHNLYGYSETKVTYDTLINMIPNKRPFILSRSTHTGSGRFTAHWGGDNESKWYSMYFSIPQALSFGMYGVPFFGVDACGFGGDSDEELCSRWMQLASFFPFYRNHNSIDSDPQEPYVWKKVTEVTRSAIEVRYSLLPYYYTLLHDAHETGVPPMRALSWVFPNDPTLIGADRQFFIGDALLITPVLEPGVTKTHGVFPGSGVDEVYYEFYTFGKTLFKPGVNASIQAPLGYIPLHIRGGYILPLQNPGYTIAESKRGKFQLLVALRLDGTAEGHVYLDDGESLVPKETLSADFKVANKKLTVKSVGTYFDSEQLRKITILGVSESPMNVFYQEHNWDDKDVESCGFVYENGHLIIDDLDSYTDSGAFAEDFTISWD